MTELVWFRNDLRQFDNRALSGALSRGNRVRALFVATPQQWRQQHMAPIKQQLIQRAVAALGQALAELGVALDVRVVDDFAALPSLLSDYCQQHGITTVHANRETLINEMQRDRAAEQASAADWHWYDDALVVPLETLKTGQGQPYKVFTPYAKAWKAWVREALPAVSPMPTPVAPALPAPQGVSFAPALSEPLQRALESWPQSAEQALGQMRRFVAERVGDYQRDRDFPALDGTSKLSAALSIGLISPRQCLARLLHDHGELIWDQHTGPGTWLNELIWREFYQQVAWHFPRVVRGRAFRAETDRIAWLRDAGRLQAWQQGRTGYPIVDAAMRQLAQTGWMHNRLRMIVASFLVKDLHLDWRLGERHFMAHLIDGDFAANNGGWQWAASTGTDAAPYFRIFNPTEQGKRFDPEGRFIRHYLPELAALGTKALHQPPSGERPADYPAPLVDHKLARLQTLEMFKAVKEA